MAATIGATVVVHELKKDVHQQYKLPINIFRTGKGCGKYYDASTPEAKEHVMLMQNILWLFDPEQSTNNRLDFNPEKQEHVTNYVKLLIKARKELVDIGKTALNHELAKKFVKAGVADEDGNEYANEDDFVKVLEAVKKRFAHESAMTPIVLFLYENVMLVLKNKQWKEDAASAFNNRHNTTYEDGTAWALNGSRQQHSIMTILTDVAAKIVNEKFRAACDNVLLYGIRKVRDGKRHAAGDKTVVSWDVIQLPPHLVKGRSNNMLYIRHIRKTYSSHNNQELAHHVNQIALIMLQNNIDASEVVGILRVQVIFVSNDLVVFLDVCKGPFTYLMNLSNPPS